MACWKLWRRRTTFGNVVVQLLCPIAALLAKAVWNSSFRKVSKCACAACAVSKIVVCSKVVDPEGNPLWRGEMTVSNDAGNRCYKQKRVNFRILVKSGTKRIVLIIKAEFQGLLEDTRNVFELHEGQVSFIPSFFKRNRLWSNSQIPNKKKASLLKDPGGDQTLSIWTFLQIPSLQLMEDYILVRSLQASGWLILEARQTWQQPLGIFRR